MNGSGAGRNACRLVAGLVAVALVGGGCGKPATPALARREAKAIWEARCLNCHGPNGAGDGPQARLLQTKPRRLNDQAWQQTVTDDHLRAVIVGGGERVGMSALMVPNPDLARKPEVVEALVAHIRGL